MNKQQISQIRVDVKEVDGFAKFWRNGLLVLDDVTKQFTADFATAAVRSFLEQQLMIAAMQKKAAEALKPTLITEG